MAFAGQSSHEKTLFALHVFRNWLILELIHPKIGTMIEYLRHMAVFARVVDEGSFRGAARTLNVAPSRVSETVSELEAYLGMSLLNRSTRKTALTSEGRIFYARVVEMLRSAEAGLNDLNALTNEPEGALKVSIPAFMASSGLTRAIGEFSRAHSLVKLSVNFSDRPVGLIEAGYDVNIRVGWLDDSAMMSRKLGEEGRMLVAGKAYAEERSVPTRPSDLESWDWIGYDQRQDTIAFKALDGTEEKVNHLAQRGIDNGLLVPILQDWSVPPLGFYAVWPDKSRRESLALLFVRFLADNYKATLDP